MPQVVIIGSVRPFIHWVRPIAIKFRLVLIHWKSRCCHYWADSIIASGKVIMMIDHRLHYPHR